MKTILLTMFFLLMLAVTGQTQEKGTSQHKTPSPSARQGMKQRADKKESRDPKKAERKGEQAKRMEQEHREARQAEHTALQTLKKADEGVQAAVAALQRVLAELPSPKTRKVIQRNINRLQSDHRRVMTVLNQAEKEQYPSEERLNGTINPLLNSIDKGLAELQQRIEREKLPSSAIAQLQSALASLTQSRSLALEARNQIKANERERLVSPTPASPKKRIP